MVKEYLRRHGKTDGIGGTATHGLFFEASHAIFENCQEFFTWTNNFLFSLYIIQVFFIVSVSNPC